MVAVPTSAVSLAAPLLTRIKFSTPSLTTIVPVDPVNDPSALSVTVITGVSDEFTS